MTVDLIPGISQSCIVFVDLFGSTRVFEQLGNTQATRLVTKVTHWVAQRGSAHQGRAIKLLGDGVMISFADSAQAIAAAIDIQRSHQSLLPCTPDLAQMPLRIGMAYGEIHTVGADCYGIAVHIAARLCELASMDQILADSSVVKNVSDSPKVHLKALGAISIRGLSRAYKVYQIEWQKN